MHGQRQEMAAVEERTALSAPTAHQHQRWWLADGGFLEPSVVRWLGKLQLLRCAESLAQQCRYVGAELAPTRWYCILKLPGLASVCMHY
jgi:hypothetical protein